MDGAGGMEALEAIRGGAVMRAPKIITKFEYPPIPDRRFDWSAVTEDYDLGSPIGHGATKAEAVADLLEQLEERA
jgi:hypothetical protein